MTRVEETNIFDSFFKVLPDFAGRPVSWSPGGDPPDILCVDATHKRIGVELGEWLDELQTKTSKDREKMEKSYIQAIQSDRVPPHDNIGMVWLDTKPGIRLQRTDMQQFHEEIFKLIHSVDSSWHEFEYRDSPQGFSINDFSRYPCLDRYLNPLRFFSRSRFNTVLGVPWIRFPNPGQAYSPQTAIDALLRLIDKKTRKYGGLHEQQKLDELYLVAYYNNALFHNTPFLAPGLGFREVANLVAPAVRSKHGVFQKVFLFNAIKQDQEAVMIWSHEA